MVWGLGFSALPLMIYPSAVESASSPAIIGSVLVMTGSQLATIRHEFFGERTYEELSVHMVLEIPGRVIFFMAVWVMALQALGMLFLLGVWAIFGREAFEVLTENAVETLSVTVLVLRKLTVEWARFRANRDPNPSGIASWFTPKDPLAE
ncbi:hypothetical protein BG842_24540 [Haladaptatus sp. W1]|nr:hypothetical protein BG842_21055 [Haladaptatus sp. W1]ODR82537.1 hypothetical protein BG842_24540 [Haladaptatus sp. W1]